MAGIALARALEENCAGSRLGWLIISNAVDWDDWDHDDCFLPCRNPAALRGSPALRRALRAAVEARRRAVATAVGGAVGGELRAYLLKERVELPFSSSGVSGDGEEEEEEEGDGGGGSVGERRQPLALLQSILLSLQRCFFRGGGSRQCGGTGAV